MMIIYFAIMAGCWWIGYEMGRTSEKVRIKQQLEQQMLFAEQLEMEKKRTADETRKQLKFENDERQRIRKRIEKEEAERRTSLSPAN